MNNQIFIPAKNNKVRVPECTYFLLRFSPKKNLCLDAVTDAGRSDKGLKTLSEKLILVAKSHDEVIPYYLSPCTRELVA